MNKLMPIFLIAVVVIGLAISIHKDYKNVNEETITIQDSNTGCSYLVGIVDDKPTSISLAPNTSQTTDCGK